MSTIEIPPDHGRSWWLREALAHGEFVLVGGYILFVLCHGIGWPWPAALAMTVLGGAFLGAALPPLVRRLPRREVNAGKGAKRQPRLVQGSADAAKIDLRHFVTGAPAGVSMNIVNTRVSLSMDFETDLDFTSWFVAGSMPVMIMVSSWVASS